MNSMERTKNILKFNGSKIDRFPIDLHSFAMAAYLSPYGMDEVFRDSNLLAESQIDLWKIFKHDVILLENGVTALAEAMGANVKFYSDAPPEIIKPLLDDLDDVKNLSVPKIKDSDTLLELLKATKIVKDFVGDDAFVMGRADQGPFSLAASLRGIENFMLDLTDPSKKEFIVELLEICTETVKRFACAQIEYGADATSMGDSIAGPELISPKMYKEFAFPYESEVISAVHKMGGIISLHICGDCTKIVEKMVATGADILEIDEKADLDKAFKVSKNNCCLLGPISPALLKNGDESEIINKTKEILSKAKNYSNLIIGPGCALPQDTPVEKINLFIEISKKFGKI